MKAHYEKKEYKLNISNTYLRTTLYDDVNIENNPENEKCNNFNERKNKGTAQWILEHHTVSNYERTLKYFLKGIVSSHYIIDVDGKIDRMVLDRYRAYHAGVGLLNYPSKLNPYLSTDILKNDMNSWSIGIENVNDGKSPFSIEQIESNVHLLEKLVNEYKINPKYVIGHSDWAIGRKIDPSPYFPWEKLAKASEIWPDIDNNFGVYSFIERKEEPEIIVSPTKTNLSDDIIHIQRQLQELGYPVLLADDKNLGIFDDALTSTAMVAFNIHYMNQDLIKDEKGKKLWEVMCNDAFDQNIVRKELLNWTENHDAVLADVLDLYSRS